MKSMPCWMLLMLAALLLAGCGSPLVKAQQRVEFRSYSLQSPVEWSQFFNGRQRIWTRDGPALNQLMLFDGVRDREHVFLFARDRQMRKGEGALFRSGMADLEAVELIADGLQTVGASNVSTGNVRPFRFGRHQGFAFDFQFDTQRGLQYRGLAAGAMADGKLSYLLYFAPREYFYERDEAAVRSIFDSVQTR